MAKIRNRVLHWGNKYDGPNTYKAGREGALDDAFWDEDELVDYRSVSKKQRKRKKKGCPGNDGGPHIYVWVPWDESMIWHKTYAYEIKKCCGCLKRGQGFRRKK